MYLSLAHCYSYVPRISLRSNARAAQTFIGNSTAARLVPVRMVEGHQCHRVGHAHRRLLLGKSFKATSPNGRFAEGAAAIDGKQLSRIEIHGKNLFYFWSDAPAEEPIVMHFHFGMSGAFRTMSLPGREPTETTRLQLVNEELGIMAHLSAMTLQHGGMDLYLERTSKLGPDPLREDADKEALWAKLAKCKKPIGLVLMDQSMVAGVGNIYRAEVLYKARIHPEQPACSLSRQQFELVWHQCVDLLQRGFVSGSILTVDPEDAARLGKPWTRRYIYNHSHCGNCGGAVRTWPMAARTVYCCETCQLLPGSLALGEARARALQGARDAQPFLSHCAPDAEEDLQPAKMTVAQIKGRLLALNLDTSGRKQALVQRLESALRWLAAPGQGGSPAAAAAAAAAVGAAAAVAMPATPGAGKAAALAQEHAAAESPAAAAAAGGSPSSSSLDSVDRADALLSEALAVSPAAAAAAALAAAAAGATETASASASAAGRPAAAAARVTVAQLRQQLQQLGLPAKGSKELLLARLAAAAQQQQQQQQQQDAGAAGGPAPLATPPKQPPAPAPAAVQARVKPGTAALAAAMASAREAALEKMVAGESRAVEHVALADDETELLIGAAAGSGRGRKRRSAGVGAAAAAAGLLPALHTPAAKQRRVRKQQLE